MSTPIFPSAERPHAPTMRAAVYRRFGPPEVIEVHTLVRPVPGPHEVGVRVGATTVTAACTMMRRGDTLMARAVLGPLAPRKRFQVAGIEFAGTIDDVGAHVSQFKPGDRVYGFAGFHAGAYGQYCCVGASSSIAPMPEGLDFGQAASLVDGPTTALFFLEDLARLRPGERVLVIGASGSVGGAAVQVAVALGATVTGVCSGANVELVRSLGAQSVVDYTREDFTAQERRYDVIFDAVTRSSFAKCKGRLRAGGRYLATVPRVRDYWCMAWTRFFGARRVLCGMSIEKRKKLGVVADLVGQGRLRPVIDRRYALDGIVEAHRYVDTGRKRGNVVIDMPESNT